MFIAVRQWVDRPRLGLFLRLRVPKFRTKLIVRGVRFIKSQVFIAVEDDTHPRDERRKVLLDKFVLRVTHGLVLNRWFIADANKPTGLVGMFAVTSKQQGATTRQMMFVSAEASCDKESPLVPLKRHTTRDHANHLLGLERVVPVRRRDSECVTRSPCHAGEPFVDQHHIARVEFNTRAHVIPAIPEWAHCLLVPTDRLGVVVPLECLGVRGQARCAVGVISHLLLQNRLR